MTTQSNSGVERRRFRIYVAVKGGYFKQSLLKL